MGFKKICLLVFVLPAGIVFGADNNLYVADQNNNRMVEYDGATGACRGAFASGASLNLPSGLVFGGDRYLYVANLGGTAGSVSVETQPVGIAISPLDDNVYVTDNVAAGQVFAVPNIPAGGTTAVALTFPAPVGTMGSKVVLATGGTYSGGSFGAPARVTMP